MEEKDNNLRLFDYDTLTSAVVKDNYEKTTEYLKSLIKQAENSGKAAWTAGQELKEIKDKTVYKVKYGTFKKYVAAEFNITDITANQYIKIHMNFNYDEIGNLLLSYLFSISEIEDDSVRRELVDVLNCDEIGNFTLNEVLTIVQILNHEKIKIQKGEIRTIILKHFLQWKNENELEKKKRDNIESYGDKIVSEIFPEISNLFEYQPINEMGVVGLFCVCFLKLKSRPFSLKNINKQLSFKSIKYIQSSFPDAHIICSIIKKSKSEPNKNTELDIEFEYKSRSYITHKHHRSQKKCDMIICWEDNLRNKNDNDYLTNIDNIPEILELKDFLKTGIIKLR